MVANEATEHGVVITIVYDGPPRAGKTTSVRALARSFGREAYTPEERDGRTVYFDWLEHTGGRFEGLPIRCQVASIPGQRHWRRRRAHFLERADVVVFVGDTTAKAWPETVQRLAELRRALDDREGTPVGLVFQANKRDCADAVGVELLVAQASAARTAVVQSIADTGTGVREAFVFAVRLALDRVRAERGELGGRPGFGIAAATELVDVLRGIDPDEELEPPPLPSVPAGPAPSGDAPAPSADAPSSAVSRPQSADAVSVPAPAADAPSSAVSRAQSADAVSVPAPAADAPSSAVSRALSADAVSVPAPAADAPSSAVSRAQSADAPSSAVSRAPSADAPSGFVWPPVEGRVLLREAAGDAPRVDVDARGDLTATSTGWTMHSSAGSVFADVELARVRLVEWARKHAALQAVLSRGRCIVLATTGDGRWRLWQVVRSEPSLRALARTDSAQLLESLTAAAPALASTVDTIGLADGRPVFIGFVPPPGGVA